MNTPAKSSPSPMTRLIERAFRSNAVGRALAAAYLQSVDPVASTVQRVAGSIGLPRLANRARDFRLWWREWFEAKICTMAEARLREDVGALLRLYQGAEYLLPREASLVEQVLRNLGNDAVFMAEMTELQSLLCSSSALRRRLQALDRGAATHVAVILQTALAESGINDAAGTIWIAESSK
jgi:hypothetical protein